MTNQTVSIVNMKDLAFQTTEHGDTFFATHAAIGKLIGSGKLGCRLTVVPPGRAAWPFHCHLVNEEMVIVLDGQGRLRFGASEYILREGDCVAFPPGDEYAHQILNDGEVDLRYLVFSTMEEPDVVLYPDSGKVSVFAGSPPGGDKHRRTFSGTFRRRDKVDYWEGE